MGTDWKTSVEDLVPTKAKREKQKISIALTGGAGSGKTASALIFAKGILKGMYPDLDDKSDEFWEKVWLADTEHSRSLAYANNIIPETGEYIGAFTFINFTPPYHPDRVASLIEKAHNSGCEVFIMDSFSHTWEGIGGELDIHQSLGGTYAHWKAIVPLENRLYDNLFRSTKMHIISCVRSKTAYNTETTETGKLKITKVGLQPIARENFEYEPWVTLHLTMEHRFVSTNDKTGIFSTRSEKITTNDGILVYKWAEDGVTPVDVNKQKADIISKLAKYKGNPILDETTKIWIKDFKITALSDMPITTLENLLNEIEESLVQTTVTPKEEIMDTPVDIPETPVEPKRSKTPAPSKKVYF